MSDHRPNQFWYGTESLWTLLSVPGTWNIVSNVLASKCAYRTKLTYWRQGFDWRKDKPELTVVAKRLDRDEPLVIAEKANAVFVGTDKPAIMTAIDIPTIGCWEITAQYGGGSLSFVANRNSQTIRTCGGWYELRREARELLADHDSSGEVTSVHADGVHDGSNYESFEPVLSP